MDKQPYQPSETLIQQIKEREGFTPVCKHLRGDRPNVFTWGYGQTGCVPGATITQPTAYNNLVLKLQNICNFVKSRVKVPLTQGQLDALVDFTYNVGETAFQTSTLLRLLNTGDYEGADKEFDKWDLADGVMLSGLLIRRQEEAQEFLPRIQPQLIPPNLPEPPTDHEPAPIDTLEV